MRVDYEGEIKFQGKNLWVQADYHWEWDTYGTAKVVVVDKLKAFDDSEKEVDVDEDLYDALAEIIEDESND